MFKIGSKQDYLQSCKEAKNNPEAFWDKIASHFSWIKKWHKTFSYDFSRPEISWFDGGKVNIVDNCLNHPKDDVAIIWESNSPQGESQKITYGELESKVNQFANLLLAKNIKKGDRVCIYTKSNF